MVGTRSTRNKGKEPTREPLRERSLSYDDPNALGEAGENQAARQETGKLSIGAKDIARYLEITRSIDWNENTGPQSAGAGKQRTASVLQRRGDVSQPACSRCEQGNRVFGSCVAAPVISGYAFQRGACANCIWDGKERSCSLKGENMLLDSTSILQFTGEGFNLRQAILEEAWIDGDDSQLEPSAPMEMEVYVDPENEVDAPDVSSDKDDKTSSDKNDDKASSDKENVDVATFLAEIKPDSSFARIGISQHGPRCRFDGVELKFPISREIWESERRLLKARSDLAHFVAIIDARLFDMGHGRSDAVFWEREARRLTRLFATGIRRKRGRPASSRRPSLTPPPRIVVSEATTTSSQLMPEPTPQTEPQSTGETIQALTEPPQSLLPSTNTEATRSEAKPHTPPTIATSSRDQRVWDRPQTPENKHNDKESPAFGPVHVQEDFENLHDTIEQFTAVMGGPPKAPAEEPAPTCVDPDEEERESCKQLADPAPAPAPTEPVRAKFTDNEERAATELRRPFWTLRRPRPKDLDEGPPPIVSKRFRSERHGDRASE